MAKPKKPSQPRSRKGSGISKSGLMKTDPNWLRRGPKAKSSRQSTDRIAA